MADTFEHDEVVKVALQRIASGNDVLSDYKKWHDQVAPEWKAVSTSEHLNILEPFQHLHQLTLAIKANCLVNKPGNGIDHSSQVPGYKDAFPDKHNSFLVLQEKAVAVDKSCKDVLAKMDNALKKAEELNPEATDKSTNAKKHWDAINLSITAVGNELKTLQNKLPGLKTERDNAQNVVTNSQKTVDELDYKLEVNKKKSAAAFDSEPEQDYNGDYDVTSPGYYSKVFDDEVKRLEPILAIAQATLENEKIPLKAAKKRYTDCEAHTADAQQTKTQLDSALAALEKLHSESATYAKELTTLRQQWTTVTGHAGMLSSCAAQLVDLTETEALVPTRAQLSLPALDMVNQGSPFAERSGMLDELQGVVAQIEGANDWEGADEVVRKLRSRLGAVKGRLAELRGLVVPGQITNALPEPLLLSSGKYDGLVTAAA